MYKVNKGFHNSKYKALFYAELSDLDIKRALQINARCTD